MKLPGQSNLSLLSGNVCGLLRSLHRSVHLLSYLTGPKRNQVLPFAAHQNVLLVLSFLLCTIRKGGWPIAVTFVAKPLPLVLQPIGPPTHTEPCPLVVLPLPAVSLCCRGVHVIVSSGQIGICIPKTGKMERTLITDSNGLFTKQPCVLHPVSPHPVEKTKKCCQVVFTWVKVKLSHWKVFIMKTLFMIQYIKDT